MEKKTVIVIINSLERIMHKKTVIAHVKKAGVRNPEKPSAAEIKYLMDAYIKDKQINANVLKDYFNIIGIIFTKNEETLRLQITKNAELDKQVLDALGNIIENLEVEAVNADSQNDKKYYYEKIHQISYDIRNERERIHERSLETIREFSGKFAKGVAAVTVGAIAIGASTKVVSRVLDTKGGKAFLEKAGDKLSDTLNSRSGREAIKNTGKAVGNYINSNSGKETVKNAGKAIGDYVNSKSGSETISKIGDFARENSTIIIKAIERFMKK